MNAYEDSSSNEEMLAKIHSLAELSRQLDEPGFNAYEFSNGNCDGAYDMGFQDGQTTLAREIEESL